MKIITVFSSPSPSISFLQTVISILDGKMQIFPMNVNNVMLYIHGQFSTQGVYRHWSHKSMAKATVSPKKKKLFCSFEYKP